MGRNVSVHNLAKTVTKISSNLEEKLPTSHLPDDWIGYNWHMVIRLLRIIKMAFCEIQIFQSLVPLTLCGCF